MAEGDDQDQRTESPTQKRLDEAREKGQVPRSRDLSAAAVTLAGGIGLYSLGGTLAGHLLQIMRSGLTFGEAEAHDSGWMLSHLQHSSLQALMAAAPLLGLLLAAAVMAPLAIGGWTFSVEALMPNFGRMDPISGFGRVFSTRGLIELAKNLMRFIVVGVIGYIVLRHQFPHYNALTQQAPREAIGQAMSMAGAALIALGGSLAALALVDVPITLWQHNKGLRMSREEIKQEWKDSEGSPEMKGKVRRTQQEMARRRMMLEVPKADVIVTNPTHFAVALRYDDKKMRAPVVVAMGQDLVALRIREIATEHNVPIFEAPPLARALYAHCELGDEIPSRLYAAVAKILTYVYQLRSARSNHRSPPPLPKIEMPADASVDRNL